MELTKKQREAIRIMFGGCCAYCGRPLSARWHADHVKSVQRITRYVKKGQYKWETVCVGMRAPENDNIDNFFPACIPCNIHKADMELETWRRFLQRQVEIARRNSAPFRHAERFGLVIDNTAPVVFYFEKLAANSIHSQGEANGGQEDNKEESKQAQTIRRYSWS